MFFWDRSSGVLVFFFNENIVNKFKEIIEKNR